MFRTLNGSDLDNWAAKNGYKPRYSGLFSIDNDEQFRTQILNESQCREYKSESLPRDLIKDDESTIEKTCTCCKSKFDCPVDENEDKEYCDDCAELIDDYDEGAVMAYFECGFTDHDSFQDHYAGHYDSDEALAEELITECGDIPKDFPHYIIIDWEATARNIMQDYSTDNGYYFRR